MFHARAVRAAGGRRTVPVLVDGGHVFTDSSDIVAHAHATGERPLYPDGPARAEIDERERVYAGELGVEARRLAYSWFLDYPRLLLRYNNQGAPLHQRVALRLGFRFARRTVERHLDITEQTAARAAEIVASHLDAVAARLQSSEYLAGDTFTAADLTFASMIAPLILPAEYSARMPDLDELPPPFRDRVTPYREHPAGAFALEMFRRHR
jgi:glutathione S-transferase